MASRSSESRLAYSPGHAPVNATERLRSMNPSPASGAPSAALVGGLCYLVSSLVWGLNIPLTSRLFSSFDPYWLALLRLAIASTILGSLVAASSSLSQLRSPIPLWRVLVMSLCVSCFFVFFNLGLRYTNPITAAAIMAGSPVYGAVVFRWMNRSPLEKGFWGAAALTIIGAGIAIYGKADNTSQSLSLQGGEPLIVLSFFAWTAYSILAQRWFTPETSQLRRTFLTSAYAVPWLFVWWVLARAVGLIGAPNLNPSAEAITNLLITAALSSALGAVAWNTGVARLGINAGVMWQNTVPVFAVLISLLVFSVIPLPEQVIGGLVVLAGVLYMQWQRMRTSRAAMVRL
jgi:drug/metabolite transporter (DMT)-like permease